MEIGWMIGILVLILIACIVTWGARMLMRAWGVGDPIATTVYVLLVVIFAVLILTSLGGVSYGPIFPRRG